MYNLQSFIKKYVNIYNDLTLSKLQNYCSFQALQISIQNCPKQKIIKKYLQV